MLNTYYTQYAVMTCSQIAIHMYTKMLMQINSNPFVYIHWILIPIISGWEAHSYTYRLAINSSISLLFSFCFFWFNFSYSDIDSASLSDDL